MKRLISALALLALMSACTPEVGSPEWCKAMKEKPKKEWTIGESKDYLKHCIM